MKPILKQRGASATALLAFVLFVALLYVLYNQSSIEGFFTSRPEKFRWVRKAFVDAVANNPRDMDRDALWTRARV